MLRLLSLSLLPLLTLAHLPVRHLPNAAAGQQHPHHDARSPKPATEDAVVEDVYDSDLALDLLPPILAERQSVGTGGVNASTGNITAGIGDISLEVGDITIQTGNLTLEDIVLGNIVVIVEVGVGGPENSTDTNSTSPSSSSGAAGGGNEDATVRTITSGGEEEIEIVTVVSDPSTFYTFSEEPSTTTIAEISATHIEIDEAAVSVAPTIRERAPASIITPAPHPRRDLDPRQVSISPSISVGGVSVGVGEIGATIGNINVTVGDVFVGLGDITIKNVTIGNVFVSVDIQANLKRSDGSQPTHGIRVERMALPEPKQTGTPPSPWPPRDRVEKVVMEGLDVEGKREVKGR